jgi:hypothetical protein
MSFLKLTGLLINKKFIIEIIFEKSAQEGLYAKVILDPSCVYHKGVFLTDSGATISRTMGQEYKFTKDKHNVDYKKLIKLYHDVES